MSFVIQGMDIPKTASLWLMIKPDGKVYKIKNGGEYGEPKIGTAVPLPAGHGRIVDAAEVIEKANNSAWFDGDVSELGLLLGSEVTTIVPAEGGTDDVQCL